MVHYGLYRIQAARTGQYAGISDPEYGPAITSTLAGVEVTYPEWCRVTVKRQMSNGHVAEFTASERWLENYATSSRDSAAANAMWKRRAFAQLAKCAEAQTLRKAFPEVGSAPTADEMEGNKARLHLDISFSLLTRLIKSCQPPNPPHLLR